MIHCRSKVGAIERTPHYAGFRGASSQLVVFKERIYKQKIESKYSI